MKVYDVATIQLWVESKRYYDPLTGIPLSVGSWPLLLYHRDDLQRKITKFLAKYPQHKSQLFDKENNSIEWGSLFAKYEEQIKQKFQQIQQNDDDLKLQAKCIFKKIQMDENGAVMDSHSNEEMKFDNEEKIGIYYDDTIILDPNIPVVCFMGPSRNGKSTIVNDILGVKDACKISESSNVAQTKGGWIAKYSQSINGDDNEGGNIYQVEETKNDADEKKQEQTKIVEFYLLDMEGLSHYVTRFTKRLFYACYAVSNVVIWNDKEVMSDRFINLMQRLKDEMKEVAQSNKKPSFIYLKRDAGDFKYKPFKSFDEYINKHESFKIFREMNIFSSLSGFQLKRPFENEENDQ
eukprot:10337_1